jgi:glycerol uptake facilitator-like aquaporin
MYSNLNRLVAEFIGTALLTCVVIGSGIMGDKLSDDVGVSLWINAISPVSALVVLILVLGPISGAHFNPIVSLVSLVSRVQTLGRTVGYVIAQITGALAGAMLGNLMFDVPVVQLSSHERVTTGTFIGEIVATAGLIAVIGILAAHKQEKFIVWGVAMWILPAIFFTSSTSFANPAVTIGRSLSDTFAGISPNSVLPFIGAQIIGGAIGYLATRAATKR